MASNALLREERSTYEQSAAARKMAFAEAAGSSLDAANEVLVSEPSTQPTPILQNFGVRHIALLVGEQMAKRGQALDELDNATKFHNMELSEPVVEPLPAAGTVTEPPVAEPKLFSKNYLLSLELQALLDASVNALKDDASGQNTQKVLLNVLTQTLQLAAMRAEATDAETQAVMLDVMERSAQFVEANVAVPQFNSKEATGVRTLVFNVYHRLAKVLGRNTPEAVKADTKAMIAMAAERIDYSPGSGHASRVTPQEHIVNVVKPLLDADGKSLAFDASIYHVADKASLMKFYRTLQKSFSRGGHIPVAD